MKYTNQQISPILITGIERSGSSIIAKIIAMSGSFAGNTTEMSENIAVKQLVDSYYIKELRIPKNGQKPLPNTKALNIPITWGKEVENIMTLEGKNENQLWMYKSSRIAQIWPVWNWAFPNAKYIIVRRKTSDIIQSCLKTGFMTAYEDQEGWLGWIHEHEKLFVSMIEAGLNCKQIWPERMVYGDYSQIYEMLDWLGLQWKDDIVQMVNHLLKNNIQNKERGI